MGTRMLLFPGEEHMHRAPSWGGMHEPDVGTPSWLPAYSPSSGGGGGGNTWSKRLSHPHPLYDSDSWEVRAFAEDASTSGQWPPRSYSCSFCQREFRTAQALGGHMNVHRRERAQANQLAQLRSAAETPVPHPLHTPQHGPSNASPRAQVDHLQPPHHQHQYWVSRETTHGASLDQLPQYYGTPASSSSGDERYAYEEAGNAAYGAPRHYSSPSSYEAAAWRSPCESASRDVGLDLELRLGQRYD